MYSTNEEINKYFKILCNDDFPNFILKYFETKELSRLKGIGQFCGHDYCKLYNIKFWYSRFDHSVAVALITWNFTKDKKQTLAALFHDLGTPVFSHCIDFMLGDSVNQESAEQNVYDVIMRDSEILEMLVLDEVSLEEVTDLSKYSILENERPKLCADRLEGVLHTIYIWLNKWPLEKIAKVYQAIEVFEDEGVLEIGFKDALSAEMFFEAVYDYSIALQSNEDKFAMQYFADMIKYLIDQKIICFDDLYKYSEEEIIEILKKEIDSWPLFASANKIKKTNVKPKEGYYVSLDSKKRYVIPLCNFNGRVVRADKVSKIVKKMLDDYNSYKDSKYCYVEGIKW